MTIALLLSHLADLGVRLRVVQGQLVVEGRVDVLPEHLAQAVEGCRATIVRVLGGELAAAAEHDVTVPGRRVYPLTPLQQAYWVGEQGGLPLSTPAYFVHEATIPGGDVERLRDALAGLVERHECLRSVVVGESGQAFEAVGRPCPLEEVDLRRRPREVEAALSELRREIGGRLAPLEVGPPLACTAIRLDGECRALLAVRLFVLDGLAISSLLRDLGDLYAGSGDVPAPPATSFPDHLTALAAARHGEPYARALEHWRERATTLAPAPTLPLKSDALPTVATFSHRTWRPSSLERLEACAQRVGVTVDVLVMTAFATALARYSGEERFSVNVLVNERSPAELAAGWGTVGNWGRTMLIELSTEGDFRARAKRLQRQLFAELRWSAVSGVEVSRLMREAGRPLRQAMVPIAFAPGLAGVRRTGHSPRPGGDWRLEHSGLHTPQVLIDHQIGEDGIGGILFGWDVVEEAFPDGLIDSAFAYYTSLLDTLMTERGEDEVDDVPLPDGDLAPRVLANATARPVPRVLLHDGFEARCAEQPEQPAIVAGDEVLSYAETRKRARHVAAALQARGFGPGGERLVAISLPKGWEQIVAALGVLRSGSAYLPLDVSWPAERIATVLTRSGADLVIVPAGRPLRGVPASVEQVPFAEALRSAGDALEQPDRRDDRLAYVIFTSGSTGTPKGVEVTHRAAANTVLDVVRRWRVGPSDKVLALSSLGFDLSVFDVFGTLAAGGTIVVPEEFDRPDPAGWAKAVQRHEVTIWNSVPSLLDLTLELLGPVAARRLATLRLALLSGDWIPVDLPDRIRRACPHVEVVSLGGATEAAIWSCFFCVGDVDPGWPSIPYGYPLANQTLHVLGADRRPAPALVPGELHIGGAGLARGYQGEPELTATSFVDHPLYGRLYRTGDGARYLPDGAVEFLGRADTQVKVGGHRIELGEVESHLTAHPAVRAAVAAVRGGRGADRQLAAFVVPSHGSALDEADLAAFLARRLPRYMVPATFVALDELPLTASGKVDRQRLLGRVETGRSEPRGVVSARDELEGWLLRAWADVLKPEHELGVEDDFFRAGGTSLTAVRLARRLERGLGVSLPLASLFEATTVAAQAQEIRAGRTEGRPVALTAGR